jgi:serine/threonine protein phosphatase PrpC
MQYALLTDKGKVRGKNEDNLFARLYTDTAGFFMVADGMGGHVHGDVASGIASDIASLHSEASILSIINGEDPEKVLFALVEEINNKIMEQALQNREMLGMGTTLVMAIVCNNKLHISNVGDSRLYLYRDKELQLLTVDHSVVQEMYEQGIISKEEAIGHPQKNILTRAVGCDKNVNPDYFEYDIYKEDILLLCTDGLTNIVDDSVMAEIIGKNNDLEALCNELVAIANQNGGLDNITCIAVKI